MKSYKLTKEDKDLVREAKEIILNVRVKKKQLLSEVGSALRDNNGKIYTGVSINVEASSQGSICGETGAIARLISEGGKKIESIVAVWVSKDGKRWGILPPCGSCRHLTSLFGNPFVIIGKNKKVKLNEIYQFPSK